MRHATPRRAAISIHAPRTGSDAPPSRAKRRGFYFNPRSPHGERRPPPVRYCAGRYFNPRSPHGERPDPNDIYTLEEAFQSTLPARGATSRREVTRFGKGRFQSTLPARGATWWTITLTHTTRFQSTLPARGATRESPAHGAGLHYFNPRSPHGERH